MTKAAIKRVSAKHAEMMVHTMSVHFLSFSRLLAKIVTF